MMVFFLGLFFLGFEAVLREAFLMDVWTPPLLTILVLWLSQRNPLTSSILMSALLGLIADGMAGCPTGLHVIYFVILIYISAFVGRQVRLRGVLGDLVNGLLGGVVALLLMGLVVRLVPSTHVPEGRMGALLVPWLLTACVLCPLMFPLFERLERMVSRSRDFERI